MLWSVQYQRGDRVPVLDLPHHILPSSPDRITALHRQTVASTGAVHCHQRHRVAGNGPFF